MYFYFSLFLTFHPSSLFSPPNFLETKHTWISLISWGLAPSPLFFIFIFKFFYFWIWWLFGSKHQWDMNELSTNRGICGLQFFVCLCLPMNYLGLAGIQRIRTNQSLLEVQRWMYFSNKIVWCVYLIQQLP